VTSPAGRSGKSRSGLEPRFAAALAYAFGPIGGVVLLMIEKEDAFVRFHALQSVVTFVAVAVLHVAVGSLPLVSWLLAGPMFLATIALWIFLMVMAFLGRRYKVPVVGDFVERQLGSHAK
jgi:uncharacterized membrane protein